MSILTSFNLWVHDLIIASITAVIVLLSIWIPKFLEEKGKISKLAARKSIHSTSGLAIFITPYLYHPILSGILALLMTLITRTSGRKSPLKIQKELFEAISEAEENQVGYLQGPYAYCLAITILVFLFVPFSNIYFFPIAGVLIMMYSDTLAAIIGKKYGKHNISIKWVGNKRTLEGSLTFLISSFIICLLVFYLIGNIWPGLEQTQLLSTFNILILSLSMSFISTILELFSPSKYDDLIVPLGATILIAIIGWLIGVI